jgi:hypothetical protein
MRAERLKQWLLSQFISNGTGSLFASLKKMSCLALKGQQHTSPGQRPGSALGKNQASFLALKGRYMFYLTFYVAPFQG